MNIPEIDTAIKALWAERHRLTAPKEPPEPPKPPAPTVESVYGCPLAELKPRLQGKLPLMEGGKPVVRLPKKGEWVLNPSGLHDGRMYLIQTSVDWVAHAQGGPWERLILAPRRRWVYPVVGERPARPGDLFKSGRQVASTGSATKKPQVILGEPTLEEY